MGQRTVCGLDSLPECVGKLKISLELNKTNQSFHKIKIIKDYQKFSWDPQTPTSPSRMDCSPVKVAAYHKPLSLFTTMNRNRIRAVDHMNGELNKISRLKIRT